MKNIFKLLMILCLTVPFVFAQGQMGDTINTNGIEGTTSAVMTQEQQTLLIQSMNQVQEQAKLQLNQLEQLQFKVENNINFAEGLEEKKFLNLFEVQRKATYEISETGEITKMQRFTDFLFR